MDFAPQYLATPYVQASTTYSIALPSYLTTGDLWDRPYDRVFLPDLYNLGVFYSNITNNSNSFLSTLKDNLSKATEYIYILFSKVWTHL